MTPPTNAAAPHDLPVFITAPADADVLFMITTTVVLGMVLLVGVLFFWLHSLPERVAHKSKKLQLEIVAILCLISLFTHQHIFWVAGLLLAYIEIPNFSHPLRSMAESLDRMARLGSKDLSGSPAPDTSVQLSADVTADVRGAAVKKA